MKHIKHAALLLSTAFIIQSCDSGRPARNADSITMSARHMDNMAGTDTALTGADTTSKSGNEVADFIEKAAIGGLVEIEMGKMGQLMATDTQIKEFAAMVERDHTKANLELKALATTKAIRPPETLPEMKQKHLEDLKTKTGEDFDQYYVNMMVEDHLTDIALFKGATKSADTAISNFAIKTLPVLQKHYERARALSKKHDK